MRKQCNKVTKFCSVEQEFYRACQQFMVLVFGTTYTEAIKEIISTEETFEPTPRRKFSLK